MSIDNLQSPLTALLAENGYLVIDGAMGTELETRGCNLNDKLWSAKVLLENPDLIYQVHLDYLRAGADLLITSSYQASVPGYARRGLDSQQAVALITKSAELAKQARTDYQREINRPKSILVAGSIGPYGTLLADGSEYRGDYQMPHNELLAFHRPRIMALINAGIDILGFETLPSYLEIKSILTLLAEFPTTTAYISLSLKDAEHLCDGTPLSDVVKLINDQPQIIALGVNCIALEKAGPALATLKHLTNKPLLVYPNSGEQYDPISKTWLCRLNKQTLADHIDEWLEIGAKMIGGCCRTGPQDIVKIAEKLNQHRSNKGQ